MIYAHTISGTLLSFVVGLGSLKYPAHEPVDFVELILLYLEMMELRIV
jgi:hypothetical protein